MYVGKGEDRKKEEEGRWGNKEEKEVLQFLETPSILKKIFFQDWKNLGFCPIIIWF